MNEFLRRLFGGPEFWVAREDMNEARDWMRENPRDCRGFTLLKDRLIATYGDPESPYFKQMSDILGGNVANASGSC